LHRLPLRTSEITLVSIRYIEVDRSAPIARAPDFDSLQRRRCE
jgi:hypothetical protein